MHEYLFGNQVYSPHFPNQFKWLHEQVMVLCLVGANAWIQVLRGKLIVDSLASGETLHQSSWIFFFYRRGRKETKQPAVILPANAVHNQAVFLASFTEPLKMESLRVK